MKKFLVSDIEWDCSKKECEQLPQSLTVDVDDDIANDEEYLMEYLSDRISDISGYCHNGFTYDETKTNK